MIEVTFVKHMYSSNPPETFIAANVNQALLRIRANALVSSINRNNLAYSETSSPDPYKWPTDDTKFVWKIAESDTGFVLGYITKIREL